MKFFLNKRTYKLFLDNTFSIHCQTERMNKFESDWSVPTPNRTSVSTKVRFLLNPLHKKKNLKNVLCPQFNLRNSVITLDCFFLAIRNT